MLLTYKINKSTSNCGGSNCGFLSYSCRKFISTKDVSALYWYILCVAVQILAFFYVGENPIKSLMVFGSLGVAAMLIGMFSTGQVAVYAF